MRQEIHACMRFMLNRRMNVQRTLDSMLSPILLEISEMQPILDEVKDSDNPNFRLSSPKSKMPSILPLKHPHSNFFLIFLVIHSLIRTFARTNA